MYCIIIIEKALPGEELTVSEQINEVIGPFESERDCTDWVTKFHPSIGPSKLNFLIIPIINPKDIL